MLNPKLIQLAACSSPLSCVDWPSPRRAAPIAERHHSIAIPHPCRRRQQARQHHALAAQGRAISPSLAFHGVRAVLIRLLSWLPALFLISLSLNFIFYLRTQEQSKQTTRSIPKSTSSTLQNSNPLHPGVLHLPSSLHGPSNPSSDPHLAGNRGSPGRQFQFCPSMTSPWNSLVRPPFSPSNGSNRL